MNLFLLYLVIVAVLFGTYYYLFMKIKESFQNTMYLYPTKKLQKICEDKKLNPAYGPKSCFLDGKYDPYANCECQDKETGECKSCYPNIEKDERTSSVIYNASKF